MKNFIQKENSVVKFDIIIIGAGLSGICLALEILRRTRFTVIIIEKKKKLIKDKNWCFWNYPENIFTNNADNSWDTIKISAKNQEIFKSSNSFKYLRITSDKFYEKSLDILSKYNRCNIIFGSEIKKINENNSFVEVQANKKKIRANLLFNSKPNKIKKEGLKQHFFGVEVTSDNLSFQKRFVTLMDFQESKKGVHFFYILPFSGNHALVESTYFSQTVHKKEKYIKDINNYLKSNYPNTSFKFGFTERGILPMYNNESQCRNTKRVKYIGQANNWIKISTGYCFQNSFEKSKQIVDNLINNFEITHNQKFSNNFLDEIFCEFIKRYPESSQDFFYNFFRYLDFKTIIYFLTEKQNLYHLLKVLIVLPKIKLLLSLFHLLRSKILYAFRH